MTIATFINYTDKPLTFIIEPWADRHEVPPKGEVGIRYQLRDGAEDRSASVMTEGEIEFWCNAEDYEVDIVQPTTRDLLFWELCVGLGWCGSPAGSIGNFLPKNGTVNAVDFSEAVFLSEGEDPSSQNEKELGWHSSIQKLFITYFGDAAVSAGELYETSRRPFNKPDDQ